MSGYKLHSVESAPEKSRDYLKKAEKELGFIPNQYKVMAESPENLKSYMDMDENFKNSSLSPEEQQIVLMTTSFHNGCIYCMSGHSTAAKSTKLSEKDIEALRNGDPLENKKWEALRHYTRAVNEKQGHVRKESAKAFYDAGYDKRAALDVMIGVAMKTLSNYTNHFADTPLDEEFQKNAWKYPAEVTEKV